MNLTLSHSSRPKQLSLLKAKKLAMFPPSIFASIGEIVSLQGEPEQRRKLENFKVLNYRGDLKDYLSFLQFIFNENKLIQIYIELWQIARLKNRPLRDYDQIKTCLSANFGSLFGDLIQWG